MQKENLKNLEIPSRWRRFFAYLLDLLTNLIILGFITYFILSFMDRLILLIIIVLLIIFEVMFIFFKKTTPGNKSVGIIALTNNYPISGWQAMLRYFVFNPAFLALLFLFKFVVWSFAPWGYPLIISGDPGIVQHWRELFKILIPISNCAFIISMILCLLNIVEIFFKCPKFIDKRLGIKRLYKKSN